MSDFSDLHNIDGIYLYLSGSNLLEGAESISNAIGLSVLEVENILNRLIEDRYVIKKVGPEYEGVMLVGYMVNRATIPFKSYVSEYLKEKKEIKNIKRDRFIKNWGTIIPAVCTIITVAATIITLVLNSALLSKQRELQQSQRELDKLIQLQKPKPAPLSPLVQPEPKKPLPKRGDSLH